MIHAATMKRISSPLDLSAIEEMRAGEKLFLSGYIFTARDAAHKRFMDALNEGKDLPIDIRNQIIYYCGPSPAPLEGLSGLVVLRQALVWMPTHRRSFALVSRV